MMILLTNLISTCVAPSFWYAARHEPTKDGLVETVYQIASQHMASLKLCNNCGSMNRNVYYEDFIDMDTAVDIQYQY